MRKIFGGAMLFSAVGATVLGGALAWNSTEITAPNTVDVGTIEFTILYVQHPDALLGPDDGVPNEIGGGTISNDGTLNLFYEAGSVQIFNVATSNATCNPSNFVGVVTPVLDLAFNQEVSAGETEEGYRVAIAVVENAPEACMGATVSYLVAITMSTQAAN
jgi:hypothetical protein